MTRMEVIVCPLSFKDCQNIHMGSDFLPLTSYKLSGTNQVWLLQTRNSKCPAIERIRL